MGGVRVAVGFHAEARVTLTPIIMNHGASFWDERRLLENWSGVLKAEVVTLAAGMTAFSLMC